MVKASVGAREIDLLRIAVLLQTHVTPALCRAVFKRVRTSERQRAWTLDALVRFWMAVVLRAPQALTHALRDAQEGREPLFPRVRASPEAFFQRCRDLSPAFFAEVFRRVTAQLLTAAPPRYAAELGAVQTRFPAIVLLDGSMLAAIARRLKLLWNERAVVLPGSLIAAYDLGRGLCRALTVCPDAAVSEIVRARALVATLPRHSLVVADRYYSTADFFATLAARPCWGLVRRARRLGLVKLQRLSRRRYAGGRLEDWRVRAGWDGRTPAQTLRYIAWRHGRTRYEMLTNVLSPTQLSAAEALALYPYRWRIERMYFDLKTVLNLNRIYAANPNAVAMQAYAAALVYNAMRVAQSEAAASVDVLPEDLSPPKFFPRLAAAYHLYLQAELWAANLRRRAPRTHWAFRRRALRGFHTLVAAVHVERRSDRRRHRRFCLARGRWKSFRHVRGGPSFLKLS